MGPLTGSSFTKGRECVKQPWLHTFKRLVFSSGWIHLDEALYRGHFRSDHSRNVYKAPTGAFRANAARSYIWYFPASKVFGSKSFFLG